MCTDCEKKLRIENPYPNIIGNLYAYVYIYIYIYIISSTIEHNVANNDLCAYFFLKFPFQ